MNILFSLFFFSSFPSDSSGGEGDVVCRCNNVLDVRVCCMRGDFGMDGLNVCAVTIHNQKIFISSPLGSYRMGWLTQRIVYVGSLQLTFAATVAACICNRLCYDHKLYEF